MELKNLLGLTALLVVLVFDQAVGYASYNSRCRLNSPNPSDLCDPSAFLVCFTRTGNSEGFCDCVSTDTMYYNETSERCLVTVNNKCVGGFGSPGWGNGDHGGNRQPECGTGSDCERSSGRCVCRSGLRANDKGEGCSGAGGIAVSSVVMVGVVAFGALRIFK